MGTFSWTKISSQISRLSNQRMALQKSGVVFTWVRMLSMSHRLRSSETDRGDGSKPTKDNNESSSSSDSSGSDTDTEIRQRSNRLGQPKPSDEMSQSKPEERLNQTKPVDRLKQPKPSDRLPVSKKALGNLVNKIKTAQQEKDNRPAQRTKYRQDFVETRGLTREAQERNRRFDRREPRDGDQPFDNRQARSTMPESGEFKSMTLQELFSGTPYGIFEESDYKNAKEPVKTLFDVVAEEEIESRYNRLPQSAFDEQLQWTKEGKMWHFPIDNEQGERFRTIMVLLFKIESRYNRLPQSAFDEQLQWTKEGKMWHFPIDNEQGWEEEKKNSFQDHVFFDEQLKDFPKKGPVRHFMEVVTNALARNHHLTVAEKHETIEWYKQYFMEHEQLLMEKFGEDGIIKQREASS